VVATDTSWRTDPPRFPRAGLIPALTVIAVTVLVGALRYPHLPPAWTAGGHLVPKSVVSVFAIVAAQLYVTVLWTGLMLDRLPLPPGYRGRRRGGFDLPLRRFLAACTRAFLTLLALVDLTLLLAALRNWQVYRPSGIVGPARLAVRGPAARPGRGHLPRGPRRIPPARRPRRATVRRRGSTGMRTGSGKRG